ncbi:MAG: class I SAM-dependent methyltransferase [Saprospiraceae bacterium]
MMRILPFLKRIWLLNFLRRVVGATKFFNYRYLQILKWGFRSREDTNITYDLTPDNLRYMACAVADVLDINFATVWTYIEEALNDRALHDHIAEKVKTSPLGIFADPKAKFGRRLGWYVFVRVLKPKLVVETGVDKGMGAVLLCAALLRNRAEGHPGQYYGTDINPKAGYLLDGPYREVGSILYGDSLESLTNLQQPVDLFINDSDHSPDYEYREYVAIQARLHEKSILLSDNADVCPALLNFSLETGRQFLFFQEVPQEHWYPGAGIGMSFLRLAFRSH